MEDSGTLMSSPGEMVSVVAKVLGLPEATVVVHDRNLAVAGLRSKGGRGRSAARMTASDAASLLIVVTASSLVKNTVETWHDYAHLLAEKSVLTAPDGFRFNEEGAWELERVPLRGLLELPPKHRFLEALAALLRSVADGSLDEAREELNFRPIGPDIDTAFHIAVRFQGPFPASTIEIGGSTGFSETMYYSGHSWFGAGFGTDVDKVFREKYGGGDIKQVREFTDTTVYTVGNALKY
jgi:hypothetical protein